MRPDVHPGGIPPKKERLVRLLGFFHEAQSFLGAFVVYSFHALDVKRAGQLNLLRALWVCPGMKHTARSIALLHFRIFEIVWVLWLLLSVEVVKGTIELAEAVRGRQMFVRVAEMVLAELP